MRLDELNITKNRLYWLLTVTSGKRWVRDNCRTFTLGSGRNMPEPVYVWLVENGLVDCDCGNVNPTRRAKLIVEALKPENARHIQ